MIEGIAKLKDDYCVNGYSTPGIAERRFGAQKVKKLGFGINVQLVLASPTDNLRWSGRTRKGACSYSHLAKYKLSSVQQ